MKSFIGKFLIAVILVASFSNTYAAPTSHATSTKTPAQISAAKAKALIASKKAYRARVKAGEMATAGSVVGK